MLGIDETFKALYYNKSQAVAALEIKPDRFDMWVEDGLIIPVKIQGPLPSPHLPPCPYSRGASVSVIPRCGWQSSSGWGKHCRSLLDLVYVTSANSSQRVVKRWDSMDCRIRQSRVMPCAPKKSVSRPKM